MEEQFGGFIELDNRIRDMGYAMTCLAHGWEPCMLFPFLREAVEGRDGHVGRLCRGVEEKAQHR